MRRRPPRLRHCWPRRLRPQRQHLLEYEPGKFSQGNLQVYIVRGWLSQPKAHKLQRQLKQSGLFSAEYNRRPRSSPQLPAAAAAAAAAAAFCAAAAAAAAAAAPVLVPVVPAYLCMACDTCFAAFRLFKQLHKQLHSCRMKQKVVCRHICRQQASSGTSPAMQKHPI